MMTRTALLVVAWDDCTESLLILLRRNEGADHRAIVSGHAIVQYVQPEVVAARVRVASEEEEVLREHERAIKFCVLELLILYKLAQRVRPPLRGVAVARGHHFAPVRREINARM